VFAKLIDQSKSDKEEFYKLNKNKKTTCIASDIELKFLS